MDRVDGGQAFPQIQQEAFEGGGSSLSIIGGMSLRDWFAGQAIGTLINKCEDRDGGWSPHNVAAGAYAVADAMIAARSHPAEGDGD